MEHNVEMTGMYLELLMDINMYLFVEAGVREDNSMILNGYARANIPYVCDDDQSKESNYMMY